VARSETSARYITKILIVTNNFNAIEIEERFLICFVYLTNICNENR